MNGCTAATSCRTFKSSGRPSTMVFEPLCRKLIVPEPMAAVRGDIIVAMYPISVSILSTESSVG